MATAPDNTDRLALALPVNDPHYDAPSAFDFNGSRIRAIAIDGEAWFVARDVAVLLEYTNPSKAIGDHCKGGTKRYPLQTAGGMQDVTLIPERDLYRLVMRSKMPAAEQFEEWVVAEVLPAIRKTGSYSLAPALPDFNDPVASARAWADATEAKRNAEALAADRAILIEQQKPKADYFDAVAERDTLVNATVVGQKFGMSAVALNRILEGFDVYSRSIQSTRAFKQWFVDKGYGFMRQTPTGHGQAMITTTGEQWIVAKLIGEGYTLKGGTTRRPEQQALIGVV